MSDNEAEVGSSKKFFVEYAKSGRASCKHCKGKIEKSALRLAKSAYNPFGAGPMMVWHHPNCLFEVFKKQRASTLKIETPDDIEGWSDLEDEDKDEVLKYLPDVKAENYKGSKKEASTPKGKASGGKTTKGEGLTPGLAALAAKSVPGHKDNSFREFRRLCVQMSSESAYTGKTALVKQLFEKGTGGDGFKGDLRIWITLLLPHAVKRVYNLQSKQLVKLFSRILRQNQDDMLEDLEKGDISETVSKFFQESKHCRPSKNSHLTIQEVDIFLRELTQLTKEDDQVCLFSQIIEKCTSNDMMFIIRLVKNDLRINAGAKHILEALHPNAYQAFQTSRDLNSVLETIFGGDTKQDPESPKKLNIGVKVMTPVLPMLAEACKSVEQAMKKCPNGMYSEIKYDGERVQVHKLGSDFKFFSRSLKPVMPHKVREFLDIIPKAFPGGEDLILDSEILMIDTKTGQPLPFGTLGIHKKGEYKDACVCLFVFDCIYYNGKSLLDKPMRKRRKVLHQHMTEIPNRILFSETQEVHTPKDLESMMTKVFQMGLEGLVLKDLESPYEPGKRHWLKVKKDYLFGGAMADTADLVVLGAWFGTGQKGGMMSVFLMGCWDPVQKRWCTVTKVHTGHDDKTLERLQGELEMEKISKDMNRVPSWLSCTKTMVPDFVANNPKEMPVWEITGAEFTKHDVHTANGISIRFPRVTKIRDDKSWKEATSLPELKVLYAKSKDTSDFQLPSYVGKEDDSSDVESLQKGKPKKIVKTESNSEDDEPSVDAKSFCLKVEQQNSPERKPIVGSAKPKRDRDSSPASTKHPSNAAPKPSSNRSERSERLEKKSLKKPGKIQIKDSGSEEEMEIVDSNSNSSSSEHTSLKLEKKRKDSDSPDSNRPVKKAKMDDSESISSNTVKNTDISKIEIITEEIESATPNLKSPPSNYDSFAVLLASEMKLLTDPVLYHRVKGELFTLVHKAQEEQIKLNISRSDLECDESSSLNKQISNGHDATTVAFDESFTRDKVQSNNAQDEVEGTGDLTCEQNFLNGSPNSESYSTAKKLMRNDSKEANEMTDSNHGLTDNESDEVVPPKKIQNDLIKNEVQRDPSDKESCDKNDKSICDESCDNTKNEDERFTEENEVDQNRNEKHVSNSSENEDELNETIEISENSQSPDDSKSEDVSIKPKETELVSGDESKEL